MYITYACTFSHVPRVQVIEINIILYICTLMVTFDLKSCVKEKKVVPLVHACNEYKDAKTNCSL